MHFLELIDGLSRLIGMTGGTKNSIVDQPYIQYCIEQPTSVTS
jgi:hypothetical protein